VWLFGKTDSAAYLIGHYTAPQIYKYKNIKGDNFGGDNFGGGFWGLFLGLVFL